MSRNFGAEVVVLKRTNLGEADRIVTFLSKYKGKFSAVAKGVRKITSKRAPSLELLNHSVTHLSRGKNLDLVMETKILDSFKGIKEDFLKTNFGLHVLEIVNGFLADGQGSGKVFTLVLETLESIDRMPITQLPKILRAFEMKFLTDLGFKPELYQCVRCQEKVLPVANFLSPFSGGVMHGECIKEDVFARPISSSSLKVLRFLQGESPERISRLVLSTKTDEDLEEKTRFYLEYLLEKELKTAKFIYESNTDSKRTNYGNTIRS